MCHKSLRLPVQLLQLRTASHLLYSHLVCVQVFSELEIANQIISALCFGIVYSSPNDVQLPPPLSAIPRRRPPPPLAVNGGTGAASPFHTASCFGEVIMNLEAEGAGFAADSLSSPRRHSSPPRLLPPQHCLVSPAVGD